MNTTTIFQAPVWLGSSWAVLARVRNIQGQYVTQVSLTSISYSIFDYNTGIVVPGQNNVNVVIATSIYDTLQGVNGSDARWTVDSIGFNFIAIIPYNALPAGNDLFSIELTWVFTDGNKARAKGKIIAQPMQTTPL